MWASKSVCVKAERDNQALGTNTLPDVMIMVDLATHRFSLSYIHITMALASFIDITTSSFQILTILPILKYDVLGRYVYGMRTVSLSVV
jgi:hypothetical protein